MNTSGDAAGYDDGTRVAEGQDMEHTGEGGSKQDVSTLKYYIYFIRFLRSMALNKFL